MYLKSVRFASALVAKTRPRMHSVLMTIHRFSARALSNESPTEPMDAWIPALTRRVVSFTDVY